MDSMFQTHVDWVSRISRYNAKGEMKMTTPKTDEQTAAAPEDTTLAEQDLEKVSGGVSMDAIGTPLEGYSAPDLAPTDDGATVVAGLPG